MSTNGISLEVFKNDPTLYALAKSANVNGGGTLDHHEYLIFEKQAKAMGYSPEDIQGYSIERTETSGETVNETVKNNKAKGDEYTRPMEKYMGKKYVGVNPDSGDKQTFTPKGIEAAAMREIAKAYDEFRANHPNADFTPRHLSLKPHYTAAEYENNLEFYNMKIKEWVANVQKEYEDYDRTNQENLQQSVDNLTQEVKAQNQTILDAINRGTAQVIESIKDAEGNLIRTVKTESGQVVKVVTDNTGQIVSQAVVDVNENTNENAIETQSIGSLSDSISTMLTSRKSSPAFSANVHDLKQAIIESNLPIEKKQELLGKIIEGIKNDTAGWYLTLQGEFDKAKQEAQANTPQPQNVEPQSTASSENPTSPSNKKTKVQSAAETILKSATGIPGFVSHVAYEAGKNIAQTGYIVPVEDEN